jgi:hypothetical protein
MAGLDPVIHVVQFSAMGAFTNEARRDGVDGRNKSGHDG